MIKQSRVSGGLTLPKKQNKTLHGGFTKKAVGNLDKEILIQNDHTITYDPHWSLIITKYIFLTTLRHMFHNDLVKLGLWALVTCRCLSHYLGVTMCILDPENKTARILFFLLIGQ